MKVKMLYNFALIPSTQTKEQPVRCNVTPCIVVERPRLVWSILTEAHEISESDQGQPTGRQAGSVEAIATTIGPSWVKSVEGRLVS